MKNILILLSLFLFSPSLKAQKNGTIVGTVTDSLTKEPIGQATISIYKLSDSSLVNYSLSDNKGQFKVVSLVTSTNYRIIVTSWQHKSFRKKIELKGNELNIGIIKLTAKSNLLQEVIVKGEIPPIVVRNDTIEFNAESFKTLPTAFVEDLFKKLPGFEVSQSGEITVNGKPVSRILVEGREFFGGDKLIATRNLPANVINKVQVTDDILEKRRNPDLVPSRMPQVINLTFKKEVKQGGFGKVYAGTGFGGRYEAGGIFNVFRDTVQLSILGYGNNLNRTGFSTGDMDKIGGFNRARANYQVMNANGSFSYDNISFGGNGQGVQVSSGAGANFNTLTKGGVKINGKYFFGRNDALQEQLTNDIQTIGSDQLISKNSTSDTYLVNAHNIGAKIEWETNPTFSISIVPTISITPNHSQNRATANTFNALNAPVNSSDISSYADGRSLQYSFIADFWKGFKKKGRNLYINVNASKNENPNDTYNYSTSFFHNTNTTNIIDQLRATEVNLQSIAITADFREALGKKFSLSLPIASTYLNNENAVVTFYKNPLNEQYDLVVPNYSETIQQEGSRSTFSPRLRYNLKSNYFIQGGFKVGNISITNRFLRYPKFNQQYSYLFPAFTLQAKDVSLSYVGSFTEPSVQYLQPVMNNTNPLSIQLGNPDLLPTKTHQFSVRYQAPYNQKSLFSYSLYSTFNLRENSVIMSRNVNGNGVQVSKPVNISNVWDISTNGGVIKSFKNLKRRMSIGIGYNITYNRNYIEVNTIRSEVYNFSANPSAYASLNLNDKLELSLNYMPRFNFSKYESSFFSDQEFFQQLVLGSVVYRPLKKFVLNTEFNSTSTNQKIAGYKNTLDVWNAGATYLFLKADRAQLKLSVSDILQSNVGRTTVITANSIRDVQTNNLGRYFLLTLNYTIQSFGPKKQ